MLYSAIEYDMTSLTFHTVVQKKKGKLSSFVQLDSDMALYHGLLLNKVQLPMFKVF